MKTAIEENTSNYDYQTQDCEHVLLNLYNVW